MVTPPTPPRRRGSILVPALLIIIGLGFLLANLGLLPEAWWRSLWRLWPLILVLFGLEILLGRQRWGAIASLAVVLALAGAGFAYLYSQGYVTPSTSATDSWEVERADLTSAQIDIDFGAGSLYLEGLPSLSPQLLAADFQGLYSSLNKDFRRSGGKGIVKLSPTAGRVNFPDQTQEWRLRLSPRLPLELAVKAGAADVNLDLASLTVTQLRIDLGAANGVVRFPREAGSTQATIKAGASSLTLEIPPGVAARIKPSLGLASLNIDESRFPHRDEYYVSSDFESASQRLDVSIDSGVSSITVR